MLITFNAFKMNFYDFLGYSLGDGGVTFDPLLPGDRGLRSATLLMLLLSVEPSFPSVLVEVLPLLPSDTRSSSECWATRSDISDILFRSAAE